MTQAQTYEKFGGYSLLEQIGVGGMAEVFLSRHSGLAGFEKDIVIKRIRPHLSEVPSFVNMFLGEAKLAAQLSHPNIVQIYDLGRIKDSYFIAMEYVAGQDMSSLVPKCRSSGIPFPVEYALKICSSVCEALYYAHTKTDNYGSPLHIVHRDVSPENIRVAWTGTVKILDFGIAKAATTLNETKAGEIKGKLSYMSPEQVMGKTTDHRSDIFSLGVVLYEGLTGLKLFSGENDMQIMQNIVDGKLYPPSYFREGVPREVESIIMKALEKDRRKRYQSASDMQFDIDSFLAGHEFTPSAIHLSNFLKQLFKDELVAEQRRRISETPTKAKKALSVPAEASSNDGGASPAPPPPPPDAGAHHHHVDMTVDSEVVELETADILPADVPISVSLDSDVQSRLVRIAKKRGVSPEQVIKEMVADFLKFHD